MQNFNSNIMISKNCGNINRTCDDLSLNNKLAGLEKDMLKLKELKRTCEDTVGHQLNILL